MDMKLLLENLFTGDLDGMILPIIAIDDFESKIDDKVIVLAFYVKNEEAAEDLSVFLERSANKDILDTEVSNTPNKDGNYLVFVEIDTKNKSINDLCDIICHIKEIATRLSDTKSWKIKNIRMLKKKLYPATEGNIKALLKKIKEEAKD
jgi:hypothetical protein